MRNNIYLLLGLFLLITSCYRDKGSYDYTELPEVTIENLKDAYNIAQLDTLVLNPEIITANDEYSADDWNYVWRLYPGKNNIDTVGRERILSYRFMENPGIYHLYFTAVNKQTELKYSKDIEINLAGVYMDGWMVLYEKDGNSDFDLLNDRFFTKYDQDKDTYFRGLYTVIHGHTFPGKPVKIAPYYYPYTQYDYILSDQGGERFSVNSMETLQDMTKFLLGGKDLTFEGYYYTYYTSWINGAEILFADGRIFVTNRGSSAKDGFTEPICRNGLTYRAAPFAARQVKSPLTTVFYDEENCRFLEISGQTFVAQTITDAPEGKFSLNNMDATMLFMDNGFNKNEYAVMRNRTTGNCTLYALNFNSKVTYAEAKYEMTQCPDINNAISYAVGSRGEVFYYATPDNVYLYDYKVNNKADICIHNLNLAADEEITCLRIFRPNDYAWMNHKYDNKVLFVATYNQATEKATLYMYYINESNGNVDENSVKTIEIDGKVKDMAYHYGTYGS